MPTKALKDVHIADADAGEVEAVFATFDVVDLDGDVTRKGAFTDGAPVVISAYGHQSWKGALPVGKGTITETATAAVLRGQFFMDTTHGADTFRTVKALSDVDGLQEWSYSLHDVEAEAGVVDGKQVQFLNKITVKEVSPVLQGSGVGTRTLAVKGLGRKQLNSDLAERLRTAGRERFGDEDVWVWMRDYDLDESFAVFEIEADDEVRLVQVPFTRSDGDVTLAADESEVEANTTYAPKGAQFSEHATSVLTDVDALIERATEIKALRAERGKHIGSESADLLDRLDGQMKRLTELLTAPPQSEPDDLALANELARAVALLQGV